MGAQSSPSTVMVYCTCPDEASGKALATELVREGLAGCVNVVPGLTSIYKWHGEMREGTEALLLLKTPAARYQALETALKERHPYELPEIIAVDIETGLHDYLQWLTDETGRA